MKHVYIDVYEQCRCTTYVVSDAKVVGGFLETYLAGVLYQRFEVCDVKQISDDTWEVRL